MPTTLLSRWLQLGCRVAAILLAATLTTACASTRFGPPVPEDHVPPDRSMSRDSVPPAQETAAAEVLMHAVALMGTRYKFGGTSVEAGGFDCSGFVQHVYSHAANISLPRSSREQARVGVAVNRDSLKPGDLVFYNTLRAPFSHVGIYMGEGKFIHAPSRGKNVEIVEMTSRYWQARYNGARRVLPG